MPFKYKTEPLRGRLFCKCEDKNKHFVSKLVCSEPPIYSSAVSSSHSRHKCDWLASHFHRYSLIHEHDRGKNICQSCLPEQVQGQVVCSRQGWCAAISPLVKGGNMNTLLRNSSSLAPVGCITAAQSCRTALLPLLCFEGRGFSKSLRK